MKSQLDPATLGSAITSARKAAHLTQKQLAELTNISERTLRDIESGTGTTAITSILTVAAAVGVYLEIGSKDKE